MKNIILIGMMGAGKSTIGRQLAKRKHWQFYDSDHVIEERTGVNIPTIFEIEGEDGFRARETMVISELSDMQNIVLATGGGSILREENRQLLSTSGTIVYLRATPEQLFSRIKHDKNRPLMQTDNPLQQMKNLCEAREQYYLDLADIIVATGKHRIMTTVQQIERALGQLQEMP